MGQEEVVGDSRGMGAMDCLLPMVMVMVMGMGAGEGEVAMAGMDMGLGRRISLR
jgi:hypothetical protein